MLISMVATLITCVHVDQCVVAALITCVHVVQCVVATLITCVHVDQYGSNIDNLCAC